MPEPTPSNAPESLAAPPSDPSFTFKPPYHTSKLVTSCGSAEKMSTSTLSAPAGPSTTSMTAATQPAKLSSSISSSKPSNNDKNVTSNNSKQNQGTAAPQPIPLLRGTLTFNTGKRQHRFSGMWNYEPANNTLPPQRFELVRNLGSNDDTKLCTNGTYHGSFSVVFVTTNSKGKRKEKSTVFTERDVKIDFQKLTSEGLPEYNLKGKGSNQFGTFELNGKCTAVDTSESEYRVEMRKKYISPPPQAPVSTPKSTTIAPSTVKMDPSTLPPPSKIYQEHIVCLRGDYLPPQHNSSEESVTHALKGKWSSSFNLLDKEGVGPNGVVYTNPFEYKHVATSSAANLSTYPIPSGRFIGWFLLNQDANTKTKVQEKDISLKFKPNNAGGYNVEGRGSNGFGRYTITGVAQWKDDKKKLQVTIFRHFVKPSSNVKSTSSSSSSNTQSGGKSTAQQAVPLKWNSLQEALGELYSVSSENEEALQPPESYSAVSRGNFSYKDNGLITCSGKWAVTKDKLSAGGSLYSFGLDTSTDSSNSSKQGSSPTDWSSHLYKGTFQLKTNKNSKKTIVDTQLALQFVPNKQGTYNVRGRGYNSIGTFALYGIYVSMNAISGNLMLYRCYEVAKPVASQASAEVSTTSTTTQQNSNRAPNSVDSSALKRRQSKREKKLPSKLLPETTTSSAAPRLKNIAPQYKQLLQIMNDLMSQDINKWFTHPVDPVALNIPTYFGVIKHPMDLMSVKTKLEGNLGSGDMIDVLEYSRLIKLVYKNAMLFNEDVHHPVHAAAQLFLNKFQKEFLTVLELEYTTIKSKYNALLLFAQEQTSPNPLPEEFLVKTTGVKSSSSASQSHTSKTHKASTANGHGKGAVSAAAKKSQTSSQRTSAAAHYHSSNTTVKPTQPASTTNLKPLTHDQQQKLTSRIGALSADKQMQVAQIIQRSLPPTADEDEIDVEIDQLDVKTQNDLWKLVFGGSANKRSNGGGGKGGRKKAKTASSAAAKTPSNFSKTVKESVSAPTQAPVEEDDDDGFGNFSDHSEDEDEDDRGDRDSNKNKSLDASNVLQQLHDDDDDDDDEMLLEEEPSSSNNGNSTNNATSAASWNLTADNTNAENDPNNNSVPVDDAWNAARKDAMKAKNALQESQIRQNNLEQQANLAAAKRLEQAKIAANEAKILEQKQQEQKLLEQKQREEEENKRKEAARLAAMKEMNEMTQEVNMDEQRELLRQFDYNGSGGYSNASSVGGDSDAGGNSPSSEYGF